MRDPPWLSGLRLLVLAASAMALAFKGLIGGEVALAAVAATAVPGAVQMLRRP